MFMVYKWFEIFFRELADMMASCARIGMVATLKAEYMQPAQPDAALIDGSHQDPALDEL